MSLVRHLFVPRVIRNALRFDGCTDLLLRVPLPLRLQVSFGGFRSFFFSKRTDGLCKCEKGFLRTVFQTAEQGSYIAKPCRHRTVHPSKIEEELSMAYVLKNVSQLDSFWFPRSLSWGFQTVPNFMFLCTWYSVFVSARPGVIWRSKLQIFLGA